MLKNFRKILKLNTLNLKINKRCESTIPKYFELKTPLFKEILTDELNHLFSVFKKNNFELRIAGGAVRDLLLDKKPYDIDLASNALPEQMIEVFEKEKIRVINLNGLKHGNVPVRINDKVNFEITTLRVDVKTDGRHAKVEFINDWSKDALRRDFTVNALYLDLKGQVFDYVNGIEDLKNKIIRFVGVADKRVKEDYLRILRYFRFYSRVCDNCNYHDDKSINAIRDNCEGLEMISNQRIGNEMKKILSQKFSDSFMKIFYDFKMDPYLGLPKNGNLNKYNDLYKVYFIDNPNPNPITMVSALVQNEDDVKNLIQRLYLTREEKYLLHAIFKYEKILKDKKDEEIIDYLKTEMATKKSNQDRALRKNESIELVKLLGKRHLIEAINSIQISNTNLNKQSLGIKLSDEVNNQKNKKHPPN